MNFVNEFHLQDVEGWKKRRKKHGLSCKKKNLALKYNLNIKQKTTLLRYLKY